MNVSMYQAAAAMNVNTRWQEAISENLASSSIPGYKKQELSFGAVEAGMKAGAASKTVPVPRASVSTNFKAGDLKYTGAPTDLALEGKGFLAVQLPDGNTGYTRDGELHISPSGQLITKQGYSVLGDNGPVQLDPSNPGPLNIAPTGEISQGSDLKGKLKVVEFDDPHQLSPISRGYFLAANGKAKESDSPSTLFRQGYLEGANTSTSMEMAQMITSMRAFEANQRVIQTQDERMGRAITDLGGSA